MRQDLPLQSRSLASEALLRGEQIHKLLKGYCNRTVSSQFDTLLRSVLYAFPKEALASRTTVAPPLFCSGSESR